MPDKPVRLFVAAVLTLFISGCGLFASPDKPALVLFQEGREAMSREDWGDAVQSFTELKNNYPFSPYTTRAELLLADAYYNQEKWLEAAESYKEFEALHPRHERIPYVLFRIGKSQLNQFDGIDRPMDMVVQALEYFRRVSQAHPDSEFGPRASELYMRCKRLLADREVYVADFYMRTQRYVSAWMRYRYILETFDDLPEYAAFARTMKKTAYLKYQQSESEQARREEFGSWRDWFDWL